MWPLTSAMGDKAQLAALPSCPCTVPPQTRKGLDQLEWERDQKRIWERTWMRILDSRLDPRGNSKSHRGLE